MKKNTEPIFYSFLERNGYKGVSPKYFETKQISWSRNIESNWVDIKNELEEFIKKGKEFWPYFDKDIVTKQNSWKTIPFYAWGVKFHKNAKQAPKTIYVLEKIPGMVSASYNLLEAGAQIVPHYGDTNAIMRCHLGLIVPGKLPEIGFEVDGEQRSWEEGKLLCFCDAHKHTAWNYTQSNRIILLFDVIRPEYLHLKRWICSKVLASLFLQSLAQKLPFLRKTPLIFQVFLFYVAALSAFIIVPIRNFVFRLFYT